MRARKSNRKFLKSSFTCEQLERRRLLSGTWSSLTNAVPSGGGQSAVLLSDGTVMVHGGSGGQSNAWYKLTPNNGNYSTGTWTTLASSPVQRLYTATEVLPSGKVMVLGGEYANTGNFSNTGEIYNPLTNTWAVMATFPQSQFGDDPSEMLPNGNVLTGYIGGAQTYIYNVSNNSWSAAGTKLRGDVSDEESWVKLPNDDILSYDVSASISNGVATGQYYNPTTNVWTSTGNLPAQLSAANVGYELGAGVLLPDGRAFFGGGTNATAYYTPSTNTWAAGPNFPSNYCQSDAPSAVLPNGDVLMAMSPRGGLVSGGYNFPAGTFVYEFNPTTNTFTNVTPAVSGFSLGGNAYTTTFLVLPTGQVLMFNDSGKIAIYTPGTGTGSSSWAPTISNITNNTGSNTFTLTGYQLNGISEGAAYGDDNEMSSNYPIVQLTDQFGNITYARTFNWTLDGVASASSSVSFTEPTTGAYLVNVIANGIASPTVLNIQCSSTNGENFSVQTDTANTNYAEVYLGFNGSYSSIFQISSFTALIMTGDAANNNLTIDDNLGGIPTIINGGNGANDMDVENNGTGAVYEYGGNGTDYYDFSTYAENLSNIANFTYVEGSSTGSVEQVRLHDNNYSTGTTYTITAAEVTRAGFGGMYYFVPVTGIALTTGSAADTVNVQSTYTGTPVTLNSNSSLGTIDSVVIGNGGSVQSIAASVTVSNTPSYTTLLIDDSADTVASSNVVISTTGTTGSVTGLAPVPIYWTTTDVDAITINGGTGGNTFYVTNAGIPTYDLTTINTGSGSDYVQFDNAIAGAFAINGQGGLLNTINVIDNSATTGQSWLMTSTQLSRAGFSVSYTSIYALTLNTGSGNDIVDIESLPACAVYVYNNGGADSFNVSTTSKVLPTISNLLTFGGGAGSATLTLNDASGTSTLATPTITSTNINIGAGINYSGISTVTLDLPNYAGYVYITSTTSNTAYVINGGNAAAYVYVGIGNISGVVSNTVFNEGGVTFNAVGGTGSFLVLDDYQSPAAVTYTFNSGTVLLAGQLVVNYTGAQEIISYGGTGNDSYTVNATAVQVPLLIDPAGGGTDTVLITGASLLAPVTFNAASTGSNAVTVGATGGTLANLNATVTVNGYAGQTNTLVVNDLVDANFNISSASVVELFGSGGPHEVDYSALTSLAVNVGADGSGNFLNVNNTSAGTPVTVNNNNGTDTINVYSTATNAPVIISPSLGSDPVNVGTAGKGNALAEFTLAQGIGVLTVGNGGTALVTTGPRKLLQVTSVVASGTGVLDLTTNDMVVHGSTIAAVNALVATGYHAGTWTGAGITSSSAANDPTHLTALGAILNTYDGIHTIFNNGNPFDGYSFSVTDVLVKHTYYGDANLSGKVDGSDYVRIDNGFVTHASGWYNGDFNYDGTVDGSDYALIDNSFNTQAASLAASIADPAPASSPQITASSHAAITAISSPKAAAKQANQLLVDSVKTAANRVFNSVNPISMPVIDPLSESIVKHRVKRPAADLLSDATPILPN